jgi:biopolymer transport protein ExbB
MFDMFLKGGPLMWPILLCSVASATIILERFYNLYRAKKEILIPDFVSCAKESLKKKRIKEAIKLCDQTKGPLANIILCGITNHSRRFEEKEKIVSRIGAGEVRKLERNLSGLALIADISPLLGLLGTVTGLIRAFMKIQELGGRVDANQLAGGIWEALITTAFGLFVAIPTLAAYHYFEKRVGLYASVMKDTAGEVLELTGMEAIEKEVVQEEIEDARI